MTTHMNWISVEGTALSWTLLPGEDAGIELFLAPTFHEQSPAVPLATAFAFRVLLYGSGAETISVLENLTSPITVSGRYDVVQQADGTLTHEISSSAPSQVSSSSWI